MQPAPQAAAAGDIKAYRNRCAPEAPVRLGIISNPFSRTNARTRLNDRILPRFLPNRGDAIDTRTVEDFDHAVQRLLFERGVNVLGLNGGDGTLHLAVNRLIALAEATLERTGETFPLPRLLFLNGGTLNIVSRAAGTKGNPVRTVRAFLKGSRGRTLGQIGLSELPLLRVETVSAKPGHRDRTRVVRYGFVFGSEVVANALEMYAMFGEGYAGLARFLVELICGYTLNTRLWQEHGWKLDPPSSPVSVDHVTWPHYVGGVATTIDLSILKGVLTAIRVEPASAGFSAKLILETNTGRIIRMIPRLMFHLPHPQAPELAESSRLVTHGGYTLDGEVFLDRATRARAREVVVTRSNRVIQAVKPLT